MSTNLGHGNGKKTGLGAIEWRRMNNQTVVQKVAQRERDGADGELVAHRRPFALRRAA